jgi:hypothetical protein
MVLDAVQSPHSKRNYAKALDDLFQFCASFYIDLLFYNRKL